MTKQERKQVWEELQKLAPTELPANYVPDEYWKIVNSVEAGEARTIDAARLPGLLKSMRKTQADFRDDVDKVRKARARLAAMNASRRQTADLMR